VTLPPTSLRTRLVLGAVGVGLVFAVLFGALATWRVHHAEDQAIAAALQSRLELARDEVTTDGTIAQDAGSPKTDLIQVLGPEGTPRSSSPALHGVGPLADVTGVTRSTSGTQARVSLQHPDIDLAVLAVPLRLPAEGDSPAGTGALVVATDTEGFNTATSDLLSLLLTGLAAVVLAVAALAWSLTGRALRSVTQITESAASVGPSDLAAGLPVPRRDAELARLVEALNRMLQRLHHSHATELAFAADAGHRLRTPLATLRAEAELALRETDPAELTAALRRVVQDVDQLASIVDRMLARNRSNAGEPRPLLESIAAAGTRWRRQAELAGVRLRIDLDPYICPSARCRDVDVVLDPLVDNAIRHTPPHGHVVVRVRVGGATDELQHVLITVANDGDPIPPELATHIFDAWVSTRDASVAGGLGLWLARETARDLGGDVTLATDGTNRTGDANGDDNGATTFTVRLPVRHGKDLAVTGTQTGGGHGDHDGDGPAVGTETTTG
jgi:signal transduction histidine kinase